MWWLIGEGVVTLDEVDGENAIYTFNDFMKLYDMTRFRGYVRNQS